MSNHPSSNHSRFGSSPNLIKVRDCLQFPPPAYLPPSISFWPPCTLPCVALELHCHCLGNLNHPNKRQQSFVQLPSLSRTTWLPMLSKYQQVFTCSPGQPNSPASTTKYLSVQLSCLPIPTFLLLFPFLTELLWRMFLTVHMTPQAFVKLCCLHNTVLSFQRCSKDSTFNKGKFTVSEIHYFHSRTALVIRKWAYSKLTS